MITSLLHGWIRQTGQKLQSRRRNPQLRAGSGALLRLQRLPGFEKVEIIVPAVKRESRAAGARDRRERSLLGEGFPLFQRNYKEAEWRDSDVKVRRSIGAGKREVAPASTDMENMCSPSIDQNNVVFESPSPRSLAAAGRGGIAELTALGHYLPRARPLAPGCSLFLQAVLFVALASGRCAHLASNLAHSF